MLQRDKALFLPYLLIADAALSPVTNSRPEAPAELQTNTKRAKIDHGERAARGAVTVHFHATVATLLLVARSGSICLF